MEGANASRLDRRHPNDKRKGTTDPNPGRPTEDCHKMNQNKFLTAMCLLAVLGLGAGCASIVDGRPKKITINSEPAGATVKVIDKSGAEVATGSTPTTIPLKRGAGYFKPASYRVIVTKEGHRPVEVAITGKMNGWYIGNLGFGGLLGMLVVDPLTGAMWTLEPKEINAVMPGGAAGDLRHDAEGIVVVLRESIAPEAMAHATPIAID